MPAVAKIILDIAAIAIGSLALLTIIYIVVKKFAVLSSIDTSIVPRHQQEAVRDELAEKRLMRKFSKAGKSTKKALAPFFHRIADSFHQATTRLLHLEKQARFTILQKAKKEKGVKKTLTEQVFMARELIGEGKFKEAESKCIEIISVQPNYPMAYKMLGDIYMALKEYQTAKESYAHAITLKEHKVQPDVSGELLAEDASLADYYSDLASCNMAMGDYPHAKIAVEEVLKYQPNNPKFLDDLLAICIAMKDIESAKKAFERLKEVNPENNKLIELAESVQELEQVTLKK